MYHPCTYYSIFVKSLGPSNVQSIVSLTITLRHKFVKQISAKVTNTLLFLSHLLIAGCDIGVQISVRPSVRSSVRPSVRPSTFTSKFGFLYISDS